MDLKLAGDTAVVTGGASGIGAAIAKSFAKQGAAVVLIDCDASVLEKATKLELGYGVSVQAIVADVSSETDMQTAAKSVLTTFDRCDHLICAAGIGSGKFGFPFWNLSPGDWHNVLQVNLMGVVHAAHAFAPTMVEAKGGTMLLVSSIAGQIGSQTDPPYSAAKAAVISFAQCAAKDLAEYNVRVNTICPGMIQTPLNEAVWQAWNDQQSMENRKTYEQWASEKIKLVTPLNRWQEPEDVASMAVFLASPQAKNITGQTINVDGGQVMHW